MTVFWCVVDAGDGDLMNQWRTKERADLAAKQFGKMFSGLPRMIVKPVEMADTEEEEEANYLELLKGEVENDREN